MYIYILYIHMFTTVESGGLMAGCSDRLLCFSAGISCSCTVVPGTNTATLVLRVSGLSPGLVFLDLCLASAV